MASDSRSGFHSKFQKTGVKIVSFSATDWEVEFKNKESFGTQIGLLFRKSSDVSSKSGDKIFASFENKDNARKFLIEKLFALEEKIISNQCKFKPDIFCNLMGCYARLRVLPTKNMMDHYIIPTLTETLPNMEVVHLRHVLDYCADLAIYPSDDIMSDWCQAARSKGKEWGLSDTYAVLYKMAILDFLRSKEDDSPMRKLGNGVLKSFAPVYDPLNTDNRVDRSLYLAGLWFNHSFFKQFEIESENHTSSRKENRFREVLKGSGITVLKDDFMIAGIHHTIDIPVDCDGNIILCEFDGAFHFNEDRENGRLIYDGQSRFQTWVVHELMPANTQLLRIPDIVAQQNPHPLVWKDIFNRASAKGAGSYIVHAPYDIREVCAPDAWDISFKQPS